MSDPLNNAAPLASFIATPETGEAPLEVLFDANASLDSDGSIDSYQWDFGDDHQGLGPQISHTYQSPGEYTVTLKVTDNEGASDTSTGTIFVTSVSQELQISEVSVSTGQT